MQTIKGPYTALRLALKG